MSDTPSGIRHPSGEQEISLAEIMLHIGHLQGGQEAMKTDIGRIKDTQELVAGKLSEISTAVAAATAEAGRAREQAEKAAETAEDIATRPHSQTALQKTKPWDKPMSDIFGEIIIGALKLIGIAVVVYVIVQGVTQGNI